MDNIKNSEIEISAQTSQSLDSDAQASSAGQASQSFDSDTQASSLEQNSQSVDLDAQASKPLEPIAGNSNTTPSQPDEKKSEYIPSPKEDQELTEPIASSGTTDSSGDLSGSTDSQAKEIPAPENIITTPDAPITQFLVTSSPHIYGKETISRMMWTVSLCLAPAGIAGVYLFGARALFIIIFSIVGAVLSECAWQILMKKPITIRDGSAFLTGLLLAYNLPPSVPLWMPFVGSAFAIIIVKQVFGGLGCNIFNPALSARAFLLISWPTLMSTWWEPSKSIFAINGVTTATSLSYMKKNGDITEFLSRFANNGEMFKAFLWGDRAGCIGETCAILLIIGGLYLVFKKYIDWQIPVVFISTVGFLSCILYKVGMVNPMDFFQTLVFSIFSGGLILGAFFMATDCVTSPLTIKGKIIFALGCGILTVLIRRWGALPEGVCFAILIMNAFTPLIDSKIKTIPYGVSQGVQNV